MKTRQSVMLLSAYWLSAAAMMIAQSGYGRFEGAPVQVEFLEDGRLMRLLRDLIYVDSQGGRWIATKGLKTDGASIPRVFWSIVGGPFEGSYRDAAVVHDQYCKAKDRPWRDVHKMFYNACRAAGVSERQARVLYMAVYVAGPRWNGCPQCAIGVKPEVDEHGNEVKRPAISEEQAKALAEWVKTASPSLDAIDSYVQSQYPSVPVGK